MTNNFKLIAFPLNWDTTRNPGEMSFEVKICRMTGKVGKQVGVASVVLSYCVNLLSKNTLTLACPPEAIYFEDDVSVTEEDLKEVCEIKARKIWEHK